MMQDVVILSLIFFTSLFLGSFYNVLALRTLSGEDVSMPPSHCTTCNHRLSPLDLFPVFSWLFLRGKCRYCKTKISAIYPFGEILTAISYTSIVYLNGFTWETLIQLILITIMVVASVSDLKEMMVPDRFFIVGLILVIPLRMISGTPVIPYLLGGAGMFFMLFVVFLISGGKIGGADIKLYALIGASIGFTPAISSLFYSNIIAVALIFPLIFLKKRTREQEIPFVPFMTLGILATYFMPLL